MDVPDSWMLEVSVLHKRPSQRQEMLLSMTSTYTSVCRTLTQTYISRQPRCLRENNSAYRPVETPREPERLPQRENNSAYRPVETPREPERLPKVFSDVASWCSTRKNSLPFITPQYRGSIAHFVIRKTLANSTFTNAHIANLLKHQCAGH
jgi:hypothetical protein